MEEQERNEVKEIIEKLQSLQEKQISRKSRYDEKNKYYEVISNNIDKQESLGKEAAKAYDKQLSEIDQQNNVLLKEHEQFASALSKSIKSLNSEMSSRSESLVHTHKAVCSDMSNIETMVEQGWQQHSATLEQQLREHAEAAHVDLQAQASYLQVRHCLLYLNLHFKEINIYKSEIKILLLWRENF